MNSAITRAAALLRDFRAPWAIAGGWALDLFVGHESRPHADVDIAVLRADQRQLRSMLAGRVEKVAAGRLIDWDSDELLELPIHEVHVTWPDDFHLEFLLNEHDPATDEWLFRRDPRVRRPLALAFVTDGAVPYLAPEIVLLYKSKAPSAKDEADFATALPHLRRERRMWLAEALDVVARGHRWGELLARDSSREL